MKNLLLFTCAVLASCSVLKEKPMEVYSQIIDYSRYEEHGFLVSPDPYPGEFKSVGEIFLTVIPANVKKAVDRDEYGATAYRVVKEAMSYQDLADLAVEYAARQNGDALVNFKIEPITGYDKVLGITYVDHYIVSGFCIKRKAHDNNDLLE